MGLPGVLDCNDPCTATAQLSRMAVGPQTLAQCLLSGITSRSLQWQSCLAKRGRAFPFFNEVESMNFSRTQFVSVLALAGAAFAQFSCTPAGNKSRSASTVKIDLEPSAGFKAVATLRDQSADALIKSTGKELEDGDLDLALGQATLTCSTTSSAPAAQSKCVALGTTDTGRGGAPLGAELFSLSGEPAQSLIEEISKSFPSAEAVIKIEGALELRCVKLGKEPTACLLAVKESIQAEAKVTETRIEGKLATQFQSQTLRLANSDGEVTISGNLVCNTILGKCEATADRATNPWFVLSNNQEEEVREMAKLLTTAGATADRSGELNLFAEIQIWCQKRPSLQGLICKLTIKPSKQ